MFEGDTASVDGIAIGNDHAVQLRAEMQVRIEAGSARTEMLLLQGVPIGEPVAKYGPFVMNTEAEIRETFEHYRQTEFGGWPWASSDPTHGSEPKRFAQHVDGRRESPEDSRSD
ncbi:MAG: pirin-like C-terminal cupin domain-containing protein [Microthrixaceae bacterium]